MVRDSIAIILLQPTVTDVPKSGNGMLGNLWQASLRQSLQYVEQHGHHCDPFLLIVGGTDGTEANVEEGSFHELMVVYILGILQDLHSNHKTPLSHCARNVVNVSGAERAEGGNEFKASRVFVPECGEEIDSTRLTDVGALVDTSAKQADDSCDALDDGDENPETIKCCHGPFTNSCPEQPSPGVVGCFEGCTERADFREGIGRLAYGVERSRYLGSCGVWGQFRLYAAQTLLDGRPLFVFQRLSKRGNGSTVCFIRHVDAAMKKKGVRGIDGVVEV